MTQAMDIGEDIEELLECNEPDAILQCSTCLKVCATLEEKQNHEEASTRRGDRLKPIHDSSKAVFHLREKELNIKADWRSAEALDLFFPSGALKRVLLSSALSEAKGLNGITHDMVYQVICFMVDWSLYSEKGFISRGDYLADPSPFRARCMECLHNMTWKCKTCGFGAELCRCPDERLKKDWVCPECKETHARCRCFNERDTEKIMFSPPIKWACKTCGQGCHMCECKMPIKIKPRTNHIDAYYKWSRQQDPTNSTKEQTRAALCGPQIQAMQFYCAVHHYPDLRH